MIKFKSLLFALVASLLVMFGPVSQSHAQSSGAWNTVVVYAPGDDGGHNSWVGSVSFFVASQYHSTTSTLQLSDVDTAISYLDYSAGTGGSVTYNPSIGGHCTLGGMIVPCRLEY